MAVSWCHGFNSGIGTAQYNAGSNPWTASSTTAVLTANTADLDAPVGAPGPTYHCRIAAGSSIRTPVVPGGPFTQGWAQVVWKLVPGNSTAANASILQLLSGGTLRCEVRASLAALNSPLQLLVNGTLVGTSATSHGQSRTVIAVRFDYTLVPPQAALFLNGVEAVAMGPGSGVAGSWDRLLLASGATGGAAGYHDHVLVFNALGDAGANQNYWPVRFAPNATPVPGAWAPVGAATIHAALADTSTATFAESVADPDAFRCDVNNTGTILPGWVPAGILGVTATMAAQADVTQDAGIGVQEGASESETRVTLTTVSGIYSHFTASRPGGGSWTAAALDAMQLSVDVT